MIKTFLMWTWAPVLRVPERTALGLLKHADQAAPNPYRYKQNDNNVVVASVLPAGTIRVLFMQLLPESLAIQKSVGERLRELDQHLFAGDTPFAAKLAVL